MKKILLSLFKGIWVWGLLGWAYVCVTVLDPLTAGFQTSNLSAYVPIPADLFAVSAFGMSFVAFVLWEWKR